MFSLVVVCRLVLVAISFGNFAPILSFFNLWFENCVMPQIYFELMS